MLNTEKWKSRLSKPKLKVIEQGAAGKMMEVFGCSHSCVSAALSWKTRSKRAEEIRRYAIDNFTVYYVFGTATRRREYPAIAFCQDCHNHDITTKGDYCLVRERYIRNKKKACLYKAEGKGEAPRVRSQKLQLVEPPKFFDQMSRGEQTEVYRPRTPYWTRKLFGNNFIEYDTAEVSCIKRSNAPLKFQIKNIAVDYGKKEWGGAGKNELMYVIYLGERIEP